jgi:hypothetical protein
LEGVTVDGLKERVLEYIKGHKGSGGLHNITIARDLDESAGDVTGVLRELREQGVITAVDRNMRTGDGIVKLGNIRLSDGALTEE